eukprot:gene23301-30538_t
MQTSMLALSASLRRAISPLSNLALAQSASLPSCKHGYASVVEVVDGNVEAAMAYLDAKVRDAGKHTDVRRREHHKNKSAQRFFTEKEAYNRAMGRTIMGRIYWLEKRKMINVVVVVENTLPHSGLDKPAGHLASRMIGPRQQHD